jgi:hypothetical protein
MPDYPPGERPGHLDIDAVSAFVDRDLDVADLTTIEVHLSQCPACEREVLEIRTTVVLLSRLPQYEPRRSFLLGQEHARASRRPRPAPAGGALTPQLPASRPTSGGGPGPTSGPPAGGWLPGLHVAAMVTGILLLLVTAGDLSGFIGSEPASMQLAAPTALADAAPPMEALPATGSEPSAPQAALAPMPAGESDLEASADGASGTFGDAGASDEVSEGEELARSVPRLAATSMAAAAVTQAIPTPGTGAPVADSAAPGSLAATQASSDGQPSRLRIVQLALALILAWLVVSIAGARWLRRLR